MSTQLRPPGRRSLARRRWFLPLTAVIGIMAAIVVLSAFVELPGEHAAKKLLGINYALPGCPAIRDRGAAGTWRAQSPLGEARDEVRAVRVGNFAYLVGGVADHGKPSTVRTFERYDLRSGRRTALPPLPRPLNHTGVAVHGDSIYVVGGAGDDLEHGTNRFFRYRMSDRRWSELPPMPTARTALGVAVVGGRLYAIGGKQDRVARANVEAYSFAAKRWSELAPLPIRRDHLMVTAFGGAIYVAGGRNERQGVLRAFNRLDPRTGRWETLPSLPTESSGAGLLGIGGRLVVAGGENPPKQYMTGQSEAYNPASRSWASLPSMERPRHGYGSVAAGNRLWIFGGSRCAGQAVPVSTVDSEAVPATP